MQRNLSKFVKSLGKTTLPVVVYMSMVFSLFVLGAMNPIITSAPAKVYASAQTTSPADVEAAASNENMVETRRESATDTFLAEGTINQMIPLSSNEIYDNQSLFLLGGNWALSVDEGVLDDFLARIVMVAEDGTLPHIHTIQNLSNVTSTISPIGQDQQQRQQQLLSSRSGNISLSEGLNDTIAISGFADITTNGVTQWEQVAVTISIVNGNVISIIPNPAQVDHFYALPIYGIAYSLIDSSGKSLKDEQLANNATLAFHGKGAVGFNYGGNTNEDVVAENDSSPGLVVNNQSMMNQTVIDADTIAEGEQVDSVSRFSTQDNPFVDYPFLNSTISERPIVQNISENQNYLVQLRWTQPGYLLPPHGLDYQIFFLDPQRPHATEDIVPFWESNYTGFSMARPADFIDPSIILNFEAVESYDMIVYSDTGSILWQKDDLQVYGGRDMGLVTFEEEYRGPITLEISDIKPAEGIIGTADNMRVPDSVTFSSLVVE
jgi:hypothetical protein